MDQNEKVKIYNLIRDTSEFLGRVRKHDVRLHEKGLDHAFRFIRNFESLSLGLYKIRSYLSRNDPISEQIEDIVATTAEQVLTIHKEEAVQGGYIRWVKRYRRLWKENFSLFLLTLSLFIISCFMGWNIALNSHEYTSVIISQDAMETIINQQSWFRAIQSSPVEDGLWIAFNNIMVSAKCFFFGALLGIGGLLVLAFNGIFLGATMGFCYVNKFDQALVNFVVGHVPLELTIIIGSAFSSFLFGRIFYMRPYRLFNERMKMAVSESLCILMGILPWLILAAMIEVFVSPWDYLTTSQKLILGISTTGLFWYWTFKPSRMP